MTIFLYSFKKILGLRIKIIILTNLETYLRMKAFEMKVSSRSTMATKLFKAAASKLLFARSPAVILVYQN